MALRHEQINWVAEHNMHVTLKFFGETDESFLGPICSGLQKRAGQTLSFTIRLIKTGIFGSSYAPRVIWAGIEPFCALQDLMISVQNDMAELGFERDRQNIVPHLTLGRIKNLKDKKLFQEIAERYREVVSLPEQIRTVFLYESILRPEGPRYMIIKSFLLKQNEP
jgi:2'-5' RNA ligase